MPTNVPYDEVSHASIQYAIDEVPDGAAADETEREVQPQLARPTAQEVIPDEQERSQRNEGEPVLAAWQLLKHAEGDAGVFRIAQIEIVGDDGLAAPGAE